MAPTASMLRLPYRNKSTSPSPLPTSTPSTTSFSVAELPAMKWVRQDNPVFFKGRFLGKESFMAGPSSPANDSDEEESLVWGGYVAEGEKLCLAFAISKLKGDEMRTIIPTTILYKHSNRNVRSFCLLIKACVPEM
ncbi:hypothetical protein SADUNF_Sadunf09G0065300 [Salix dunnii]|uniref:Uncharacterized protein n=1 Tax=Salix dunnii TaxID=1413687 RepID=A0A835JXC6_9ROSI|nr:hypothetical protein SADUNF_Sadunf09G0065300 [Salix dunnii]